MPKIKTHKASAKRFKLRKSGSIKRGKANRDHFLGRRTSKRKRNLRQIGAVSSADMNNVRRALQLK